MTNMILRKISYASDKINRDQIIDYAITKKLVSEMTHKILNYLTLGGTWESSSIVKIFLIVRHCMCS